MGLFRDQGYKVAENEARDSLRHVDGTIRMTGLVKRRQDYLYLVDCAITGTSDGTTKDPKCSLEKIFEHNIFPVIHSLVGPGGNFDWYKPVCTVNGVVYHIEKDYLNFIRTSFET